MPNWYARRETVQALVERSSTARNASIDEAIEGASRSVDAMLGNRDGAFIPRSMTRQYPWPQDMDPERQLSVPLHQRRRWQLALDEWLISVNANGLTTQNGAITFPDAAILLEPVNEGPPYLRIEADLSSTDANADFEADTTYQRAIRVAGSWGFAATTASAGAVVSLTSTTGTSLVVTDGSLIGVGDTLLIESEQLFVSDRTDAALPASITLSGAFGSAQSTTTLTLSGAPTNPLVVGEMVRIGSERMLVTSVNSSTSVEVRRAVDGTTLASHSNGAAIYVFRTFTVTRGENGTTAATHSAATAISRYVVPADIRQLTEAMAIASDTLASGGWTGRTGSGESSRNISGETIEVLRTRVMRNHRYWKPVAF